MSSGATPLDPPIAVTRVVLWTRLAEESHFGRPRHGQDRPEPVQELW
jgi:hypothetical protein